MSNKRETVIKEVLADLVARAPEITRAGNMAFAEECAAKGLVDAEKAGKKRANALFNKLAVGAIPKDPVEALRFAQGLLEAKMAADRVETAH